VCGHSTDHGKTECTLQGVDRDDQHRPSALLLMTRGSIGINLDEVAL